MRSELQSVANFLCYLLRARAPEKFDDKTCDRFRGCFIEVFRRRYRCLWDPNHPYRHSIARCIAITEKLDPVMAHVATTCGADAHDLLAAFGYLIIWIDPGKVRFRMGKDGPITTLYEHSENVPDTPWNWQSSQKVDLSNPREKIEQPVTSGRQCFIC